MDAMCTSCSQVAQAILISVVCQHDVHSYGLLHAAQVMNINSIEQRACICGAKVNTTYILMLWILLLSYSLTHVVDYRTGLRLAACKHMHRQKSKWSVHLVAIHTYAGADLGFAEGRG